MREFTKSLASAGLAGALFSAKQVANVITKPPRSGESDQATASLNAMAQAAADQCGGSLRETFHALDQMQRQAIDTGFRFIKLDALSSRGSADALSAFAQETTQQFKQWMGGCCECGGASCNCECDCQQESSEAGPWRSQGTSPRQTPPSS